MCSAGEHLRAIWQRDRQRGGESCSLHGARGGRSGGEGGGRGQRLTPPHIPATVPFQVGHFRGRAVLFHRCTSKLGLRQRTAEARVEWTNSVADPDPGSGAFFTPDPGSAIGFFRIPDPKTVFFVSLMTIYWVKNSVILCKFA